MEEKKTDFTFEDYKKMVDNTVETNRLNWIMANITTIQSVLIEKGLVTFEDYNKRVEHSIERIMKAQYEKMSDDNKSTMATVKWFSDLFGGKNS